MRGGKSGFDAVYGNRTGWVGHECVVGCRHVVAKPVLDGPITREKRTNAFADHIAFRGVLRQQRLLLSPHRPIRSAA